MLTYAAILEALHAHVADVFFVEIGGMDGISYDPLYTPAHSYGWSGLIAEPLPPMFQRLCRAYGDRPQVRCAPFAVMEASGVRDLYYVPADAIERHALPKWLDGTSTFYQDRTRLWEFREHVQAAQVRCVTLAGLLERYRVEKIDLLQIDVEGGDLMILRQVNFQRFSPQVIRIETTQLSEPELAEAYALFAKQGYLTLSEQEDVTAYREALILP